MCVRVAILFEKKIKNKDTSIDSLCLNPTVHVCYMFVWALKIPNSLHHYTSPEHVLAFLEILRARPGQHLYIVEADAVFQEYMQIYRDGEFGGLRHHLLLIKNVYTRGLRAIVLRKAVYRLILFLFLLFIESRVGVREHLNASLRILEVQFGCVKALGDAWPRELVDGLLKKRRCGASASFSFCEGGVLCGWGFVWVRRWWLAGGFL